MINYFNFKRVNDKYLLTNDLGKYIFATQDELHALLKDSIDGNTERGKLFYENYFCYDSSNLAFSEELKPYYRESKNYLFSSTSLHIFVVTNMCNMNCIYCQARDNCKKHNGMMNKEVAKKSVDLALSSKNKYLSFEFQGGEPLLNFDIIKYIVEYTNKNKGDKEVDFNLVSNLTLLNQEIIDFILKYEIGISTSLDGNVSLHNHNRPYKNGQGTYKNLLLKIDELRNSGINVGAIQTTTKYSLTVSKSIVDTYVSLGLNNLFIRPLTPLGCANKLWNDIGYTPEQFIDFYRTCFDYILTINSNGTYLKEGHASIFLSKILKGHPVNYMELRSPCGASIGQIAYYYDGNIYTCDEGRMLAEMGNDSFKLGNVFENTFDQLMDSNCCKATCIASVLESLPNCCDCVYNPYCGTCPVVNLALNNDICNKEPNDYRCKVYKGILDVIFDSLQYENKKKILETWI